MICQIFEPQWQCQLLGFGLKHRNRQCSLGYVSQKLAKQLLATTGIQLIIKLKRNMKQRLIPLNDRLMLRKRSIIETIIDQLKNISQIEHSRHRSPVNCFVNILGGLIAYCHQPKKTGIVIDHNLLSPA